MGRDVAPLLGPQYGPTAARGTVGGARGRLVVAAASLALAAALVGLVAHRDNAHRVSDARSLKAAGLFDQSEVSDKTDNFRLAMGHGTTFAFKGHWSIWYNYDDVKDGADKELLADYDNVCGGRAAVGIECATSAGVAWDKLVPRQKATCKRDEGLICLRENNEAYCAGDCGCSDYQVRFYCLGAFDAASLLVGRFDYEIKQRTDPSKCIALDESGTGLEVAACGLHERSEWVYDRKTRQIRWRKNPKKCIGHQHVERRGEHPVILKDCAAVKNGTNATLPHDAWVYDTSMSRLTLASNRARCLTRKAGNGTALVVAKCVECFNNQWGTSGAPRPPAARRPPSPPWRPLSQVCDDNAMTLPPRARVRSVRRVPQGPLHGGVRTRARGRRWPPGGVRLQGHRDQRELGHEGPAGAERRLRRLLRALERHQELQRWPLPIHGHV